MPSIVWKRLIGLAVLGAMPLLAFAAATEERSCNMRDVALPGNSTTYVLCEQGFLLMTGDEGVTWAQRKIAGAAGTMRAIAYVDEKRGLAVGDSGLILGTEDAGITWSPRASGTKETLSDIQMVGNEGWIAGFDGIILHSSDAGKTWTKQESGVSMSLETLFFLDAKNGWAGGWAGMLLHTVDGGRQWRQVKVPGASWSITSITFLDEKNGWFSGFAGQLFRTRDGGATWEQKKTQVTGSLPSVAFDSAGYGWVASDEGLLRSADSGQTWTLVELPNQFFLNKLQRASGAIWAIGPFGMYKQTGAGASTQWKRIVNPLSADAIPDEAP
jgi:photosystem II stability/assembly factor-like uncharacterized protein